LTVLVGVALIQETLWYATKNDIHLALLLLEASAAGIVLRLVIKNLDTDQPTPPILHLFAIGLYISISTLLMMWYFKDASRLGDVYTLWGFLLAVQLFVVPAIPIEDIGQKQNEA
jgi:hypothetical protein